MAILVGLGIYVLNISNAVSYLSDNPRACINCHVMTPQYITWMHSSHREFTDCNSCHVPQDNIFSKLTFKAKDGLYHAYKFTIRAEPEVIRALEPSKQVIQQNCIRCHNHQITDAHLAGVVVDHEVNRTTQYCWTCHRTVPHGRVNSLSSVGYLIEPVDISHEDNRIIPLWLQELINSKLNSSESSKSSKP